MQQVQYDLLRKLLYPVTKGLFSGVALFSLIQYHNKPVVVFRTPC